MTVAQEEKEVGQRQPLSVPGKYLSLTTYRRDGTPVSTPVWFVEEDGRLFVTTAADSYKAKRLRRRGLRHGLLIRHMYRGHPVPDAPTSPGENARVWPSPVPHVSEGQILNVSERQRHLFREDWEVLRSDQVRQVVRASLVDLEQVAESAAEQIVVVDDQDAQRIRRLGAFSCHRLRHCLGAQAGKPEV